MGHDAFYLVDVISSTEGEKLTCITYYGTYYNCVLKNDSAVG